jgi:hypothetical protein
MRWILVAALACAACAACAQEPLEPLPLEITLQLQPATAAVGDSIRVEVNAQGGNLFGVNVDYGDGASQPLAASGARTARAIYRHAYARSGVYVVTATVTDALQGEKSATASVQIR